MTLGSTSRLAEITAGFRSLGSDLVREPRRHGGRRKSRDAGLAACTPMARQ